MCYGQNILPTVFVAIGVNLNHAMLDLWSAVAYSDLYYATANTYGRMATTTSV
jgi:hypothetical protein